MVGGCKNSRWWDNYDVVEKMKEDQYIWISMEYSLGRGKVVINEVGGISKVQNYVCFVNGFGFDQFNSFRKLLKGFSKECLDLYGRGVRRFVCWLEGGL